MKNLETEIQKGYKLKNVTTLKREKIDLNSVQIASNHWAGEKNYILTDIEDGFKGKLNVQETFGKGCIVYIAIPTDEGVIEIPPLSHLFILQPSKGGGGGGGGGEGGSKKKKKLINRKKNKSKAAESGKIETAESSGHDDTNDKLGSSEWKTALKGLQELAGLIESDIDLLVKKLSYIIPTVVELVDYNNKTVSKTAMICLGKFYEARSDKKTSQNLRRYLTKVIPMLISKCIDKTKMINQEANATLKSIVLTASDDLLYDIIKCLLVEIQDSNSPPATEREAHYLSYAVCECRTSLIEKGPRNTPLYEILKVAGKLLYGKLENTRKEGREVITTLAEESIEQEKLPKFNLWVESSVGKKNKEKVVELMAKFNKDGEEDSLSVPKAEDSRSRSKSGGKSEKRERGNSNRPQTGGRAKKAALKSSLDVNVVYTATEDLTFSGEPKDVYRDSKTVLPKGPDSWRELFKALEDLRWLAVHKPEIIKSDLPKLVIALLPHVSNLRSSIVKNTLLLFQELFISYKKSMDKTLKFLLKDIIRKSMDSNDFLAEGGVECCMTMIQCCSPKALITELMVCAEQEKSSIMKGKAIFFCYELVKTLEDKLFDSKYKKSLEELITTISPILYDKNKETRDLASDLAKLICATGVNTKNKKVLLKVLQKVDNSWSDKMETIMKSADGNLGSPSASKKKVGKKPSRKKPGSKKKGKKKTRKNDSESSDDEELDDSVTF